MNNYWPQISQFYQNSNLQTPRKINAKNITQDQKEESILDKKNLKAARKKPKKAAFRVRITADFAKKLLRKDIFKMRKKIHQLGISYLE